MSHVKKTRRGCWLWTGARDRNGYGHFVIYSGGRKKIVYPHRWLYQRTVGKIPKGKILGHVCSVSNCVNPRHLQLTTYRKVLVRDEGMAAVKRRKTHCKHGHPFDETNTYWYRGRRHCRKCRSRHVEEWNGRHKGQ